MRRKALAKHIVIIPAYNERESIQQLVEVCKLCADVCVVDDCSTDGTGEIVDQIPDVICIHHERNTHIPEALLDGMRYQEYFGLAHKDLRHRKTGQGYSLCS